MAVNPPCCSEFALGKSTLLAQCCGLLTGVRLLLHATVNAMLLLTDGCQNAAAMNASQQLRSQAAERGCKSTNAL
jgi:hypothetical protein